MKTFQEVSDQKLELMTDSEKINEIRRALKWLRKNFVPPEPEDLNRSGYYKVPFNEGSFKRWEQNANLQVYTKGHKYSDLLFVSFVYTKGVNLFENLRPLVYFIDIVQRMVEKEKNSSLPLSRY